MKRMTNTLLPAKYSI